MRAAHHTALCSLNSEAKHINIARKAAYSGEYEGGKQLWEAGTPVVIYE